MSEFVAALVGAGAVFTAAWWGQPGRKAVGIRRYVELLNDLPSNSTQREPLATEIDKMIEVELHDRRVNEVLHVAGAIFVSFVIAVVTSSMARDAGGSWWVVAVEFWVLTVAIAVIFVVGLVRRRANESSEPLEQESQTHGA